MTLLTLLLYGAVTHFQFVNYDDDVILLKNQVVHKFDFKSMFTKESANDYIPLTLATFALEYHFVKLNPMIYHLDNLILHIVDTWLVFWLMFEITSGEWLTVAFVSALFALHPLHVESVAWVTQRKDVLCTLLTLLSLIFYLKYAKSPRSKRFLAVALLFFTAALLSKAMALTLPLIFLLSDFIPFPRRETVGRLIAEKIPFFVMAGAIVVLHLSIHDSGKLIHSAHFTLTTPLVNAIEGLTFYVSKSVIPVGLSPFYKQGFVSTAWWEYLIFIATVAGAVAMFLKSRSPWECKLVAFGGLFFLISIAPVLQIVPYGNHFAYSDHYFYVPGIGLMIIYACFFNRFWSWAQGRLQGQGRTCVAFLAVFWAILLGYLTYDRVQVWRNSETLWQEALVQNPRNPVAYFNLAGYYTFDAGRPAEALPLYDKQLELTPDDPLIFFNRGMALNKLGRPVEAIGEFKKALELAPGVKQIYMNLGLLYGILNRPDEAVLILREYEKRNPRDPQVHEQLYKAFVQAGKKDEALKESRLIDSLESPSQQ